MARTEISSLGDIVAAFRDAMAESGLNTDEDIHADGDLHRFHVKGDAKGSKNGWYVLFPDGIPAGEFGSWKNGGLSNTWSAKAPNTMTVKEKREQFERIEAARQQRAEKERLRQERVAGHAKEIWDGAAEVDDDNHPYLQRKGVRSYGLRIGEWPNGTQALLIPIYDVPGHIVSLQAIFANEQPLMGRDRDFLAGGRKRGCFFMVGDPPPPGTGMMLLVEGYATGATVHAATGLCTVVAFDAGNLKSVAYALRKRFPGSEILICADNDQWSGPTPENPNQVDNPGVTFAQDVAAAIESRAKVAVPEFRDLATRPTDYNDLQQLEGLDEVRRQLQPFLPEKPANDNQAPDSLPLSANVDQFGYPHITDKGMPLNTLENLNYMLGEYGIQCCYNVMSKDIEISIPSSDFSQDNKAACDLATITSLASRNKMPRSNLMDYIQVIADANPHNPAQDWVESREWDGNDRLHHLVDTLDPRNPDLAYILVKRWMIGAVACLYEPAGMSMQGALVLQGAQNMGKTTWFWSLLGGKRELGSEGVMLNPSDKDSVKQAISYWIVELGELDATFRKADIAALKAFITMRRDELRLPYSRASSRFPRRTAFLATVNEREYLRDETGNRRYWTIECGMNFRGIHEVDMQQAWAQVKQLYLAGEQHPLHRMEMDMLNAVNDNHREVSPIEELIVSNFNWQSEARPESLTATEVLLKMGYDKPNRAQTRECGQALRRLVGEPRKSDGRQVFDMPPRLSQSVMLDNGPF